MRTASTSGAPPRPCLGRRCLRAIGRAASQIQQPRISASTTSKTSNEQRSLGRAPREFSTLTWSRPPGAGARSPQRRRSLSLPPRMHADRALAGGSEAGTGYKATTSAVDAGPAHSAPAGTLADQIAAASVRVPTPRTPHSGSLRRRLHPRERISISHAPPTLHIRLRGPSRARERDRTPEPGAGPRGNTHGLSPQASEHKQERWHEQRPKVGGANQGHTPCRTHTACAQSHACRGYAPIRCCR